MIGLVILVGGALAVGGMLVWALLYAHGRRDSREEIR